MLKHEITINLLATGNILTIFINMGIPGIEAPSEMFSNYQFPKHMPINIGLNMPVGIPDLQVDEWGICGTLSFNRKPFYCRFPWQSVYTVLDTVRQEGALFIDPPSIPVQKPTYTPRLSVVQGGKT